MFCLFILILYVPGNSFSIMSVPWVCLQFVIVVFPDHTHYFCSNSALAFAINLAVSSKCSLLTDIVDGYNSTDQMRRIPNPPTPIKSGISAGEGTHLLSYKQASMTRNDRPQTSPLHREEKTEHKQLREYEKNHLAAIF